MDQSVEKERKSHSWRLLWGFAPEIEKKCLGERALKSKSDYMDLNSSSALTNFEII